MVSLSGGGSVPRYFQVNQAPSLLHSLPFPGQIFIIYLPSRYLSKYLGRQNGSTGGLAVHTTERALASERPRGCAIAYHTEQALRPRNLSDELFHRYDLVMQVSADEIREFT